MSNEIRNPKPPTKRDLKVLEWMDSGNTIDSAKALGLFKTTGLRDILYRLRQAGHIIFHRDITYTTKEGEKKYYREWFTKSPEILKSGEKTEVQYKPTDKTVTDYAQDMQETIKKANAVQTTMF